MTGFLNFPKRTGGCILAGSFFDYDRLATFGFAQKTGLNKRTARHLIKSLAHTTHAHARGLVSPKDLDSERPRGLLRPASAQPRRVQQGTICAYSGLRASNHTHTLGVFRSS